MANATSDIQMNGFGPDGRRFHVPVKTSQAIYAGTMVAQQLADGLLVPATAAGAGPAIGKATHSIPSASAAQRCEVETDRCYAFTNGGGGDAFSEASLIGSPAYAFDDHTVYDNSNSNTLQQCGVFEGMEADGTVRVRLSAAFAAMALAVNGSGGDLLVQRGTGTLSSGILSVTGVTLTSTSSIVLTRRTAAGTPGDEIRAPSADRSTGALGTGSFIARAYEDHVAATSDSSTFDWVIVG